MTNFVRVVIRFRWPLIVLLAVVTALALWIISHAVMATSAAKLFLGETPEYYTYQDLSRKFASDEVLIVGIEQDRPFSAKSVECLRAAVKKIETLDEVSRVDSILNQQRIDAVNDELQVEKYVDEIDEEKRNEKSILANLIADEMASGLVISNDGKHWAVVVELFPDENRTGERAITLVNGVFKAFEAAGFSRDKIHMVGIVATMAEVMNQTRLNIERVFPFTCVIMLFMVFLLFRRFWPVFLTMIVSILAVIYSVAFSVLIDKNINIMISLVPAVILIVGTSDVIHLCNAYLLELKRGNSKDKAIMQSSSEVGMACLLTSLTTFIGFISLSFVPTPIFRQLGMTLGFGVAVALLLAVTICPIFFHMMKTPKFFATGESRVQDFLDSVISRVQYVSTGHPKKVVGFFSLLLVISLVGLTQLNIETDMAKRLDESNIVRIDQDYYEKHFAGTNFLEVFVTSEEKKGLIEQETFSAIAKFQEKIEKIDGVDKAVSVVDIISKIDEKLNPDETVTQEMTWPGNLLAQYLLLFEMSGGKDLERLIDTKKQTLRIAARLSDNGIRSTSIVGRKVKKIADSMFDKTTGIFVSGLNFLIGEWLDRLLEGQRKGLTIAFFGILICMIVGLRSVRIGLWSMLPNALPLFVLGGYVGMMWDKVDSDTLMIAMIAIGIGVDDTIHFLMRLRIESQKNVNTVDGLTRTFKFTGRGIIITTLILGVGFAPFAMTDYFSITIMGTLLPMTLFVALAADLVLVPAMVQLGFIRFRLAEPEGKAEPVQA